MKINRVAIVLMSLFVMEYALAETYTCTSATNRAKVGAYKTSEVGVTSDDGKKECRFSINGAPVGSPTQAAVIAGINAVITGEAISMMNKRDVQAIANLLISSSDDKAPSPALLSLLRENSNELAKCLESFKGPVERPMISKGNIFCGGVKEGAVPIGGDNKVILGDTLGMHVLAVSPSRGITHFVFFPANFRQGQPMSIPR